jgi:hypothetical protein
MILRWSGLHQEDICRAHPAVAAPRCKPVEQSDPALPLHVTHRVAGWYAVQLPANKGNEANAVDPSLIPPVEPERNPDQASRTADQKLNWHNESADHYPANAAHREN